jgi:hypothetical protein
MKFIFNAHLKIVLLFIWFYKVFNLVEINFPNNQSWNGTIKHKGVINQYNVTINQKIDFDYLKVLIKGKNDSLNNYVLSFYKNDSSFTKRYQLFQSYNREIEIWLNKDQFNDKFYFSIDCDKFPCYYEGRIEKKDNIELNLNKIYNYYATSETKIMDFIFKMNNIANNTNDALLIWAKGNKNLTVINKTKNSNKDNIEIKKEDICTNIKDINANDIITDNTKENIEKKYQFYLKKLEKKD